MIYAPESYVNAPPSVRKAVVNGCGPGGWKFDLIPDTVWFLSIEEACNIHDWMYKAGSKIEDKEEADRVFLNNMLRIIDEAGGWWIVKRLRRNRAWVYYQSVKMFGGPAFWVGKNNSENMIPA